jgi:hypothetical protein
MAGLAGQGSPRGVGVTAPLAAPKPLPVPKGLAGQGSPRGVGVTVAPGAPPKVQSPNPTPNQHAEALAGGPQQQVSATSSGSSGGGGGGNAVAPLDATALANIANYIFKANQSLALLGNTDTQANAAYESTQAALAHQQPLDQLKLETAANSRGGLYSSAYGQQNANLGYAYATKLGSAQQKLASTLATDQLKQAGIEGGIPTYEQQQGAASASRLAALAAKAPLQAPVPKKASPAPKKASPAKAAVAKGVARVIGNGAAAAVGAGVVKGLGGAPKGGKKGKK